MNRFIHTPAGVKDQIGEAYKKKRLIKSNMLNVIEQVGYEPIETPTFEYFDVFSREIGSTPSNELYKFFDSEGHTLALRPDFTPSIARVSVKYFRNNQKPVRLCYDGSVFINNKSFQGRLKEFTQLGAELIGESGIKADAEVLELSVKCLKEAGLKKCKISVGHANILKGLMAYGDFNEKQASVIRNFVQNKNFFGLKEYLVKENCEKTLITLFDKLYDIAPKTDLNALITDTKDYPIVCDALKHLQELKNILPELSFDLSILRDYTYYTGVIFAGYANGSGRPVLTGGRYDALLQYFGKDAPAIGMAILMDEVMEALQKQNESDADSDYITVALGKGRLAKKAMQLFEKGGIECKEVLDKDTRKLIFVNEEQKIRFFLAKVPDVPTYVEYGAADIGIVGADTILEEGRDLYEVMDLGFGKCKMCVCGPAEAKSTLASSERIRVSTKYPNIAKRYFFDTRMQTAEIIKLNGSIELAPILGLSDVIVDIVETGSTLRENGLEVLEEVCDLSARVVVNRVSMRMQHARISELIDILKEAKDAND